MTVQFFKGVLRLLLQAQEAERRLLVRELKTALQRYLEPLLECMVISSLRIPWVLREADIEGLTLPATFSRVPNGASSRHGVVYTAKLRYKSSGGERK